jgi:hypothetical protein
MDDDPKTAAVPMRIACLGTVTFTYTNWRGVTEQRRAVFEKLFYGTTKWHSEPQWFVEAQDLGRPSDTDTKMRQFALRDMKDVTYEP